MISWIVGALILAAALVLAALALLKPQLAATEKRQVPRAALHAELYQMLERADHALRSAGVEYWADGGTLLGLIREKKILEHDDDVDVCIVDADAAKAKEALRTLEGYRVEDVFFGFKLVRADYDAARDDGAQIDFFVRDASGQYVAEAACVAWPLACRLEPAWIYPTTRRVIGAVEVNVPSEPEAILEAYYGDWRVPVVYNHGRMSEPSV